MKDPNRGANVELTVMLVFFLVFLVVASIASDNTPW